MLSYWEKKHFVDHDLIVIGGGIVGLSTSIQYKIRFPHAKVLILERGIFPSGASSKNAGFACFGSLTEILDDLNHMSEPEVLQLVSKRYRGLLSIREFFGDENLGYLPSCGLELLTDKEIDALESLDTINQLLAPIFHESVFEQIEDVKPFGFSAKVKAVIKNKFEGELDSGKFLNSLWKKCLEVDIKILTGSKVSRIDLDGKMVFVQNPTDKEDICFHAAKIAVCTNAFTNLLLPGLDIQPGRGLVMVTKPISKPIPLSGTFHYDKGYVYFRKVEDRILLGGGRNIDFEGERTVLMESNPKIREYLIHILNNIILPENDTEIDFEWTGIMAFGKNKKPIVEIVRPNVGIAVRLGGMGVAIGWQAAEELVNLLAEV
ncbi:NAD(P)/FAD-dependent oxidoreductase [Aquiflexum gelatinilyticum]|uniref:NAD(P)/FAD-dependent oxidoreductase n=1 Tax=Aquiflexum gelatinilyticum TaxID=2961943 RepID=UPI0021677B1C|nr:FAD-dependent oxidoreductase [Aquiflexum gelatinilyticum]MCS4436412.1 FAD-binding oxidoreductase [Aquiflexum gelatinilyticum]